MDPTFEELAVWAEQRLVRSHTTDGPYDPEKYLRGLPAGAGSGDHFRGLATNRDPGAAG